MDILQVDPANRKQVQAFLDLPRRIYRDMPLWVPPMEGEERLRLNTKRYPFYKHSAAAFFLACRDTLPVGRLAVLDNRRYNDYNHSSDAFFFLFECDPDPQAAQGLFEAAIAWARGRGLDRMLGPKGFTALDGLGLLVKGFERRPALGLPYNPAYYAELIEGQGFEKKDEIVSGYLSANIQFPERIHELATRIRERRGLQIARFRTRRELRRMLGHLKSLYNAALEGTNGGTPITDEEIQSLANQILWFADPRLIKIVMKDEKPVGFLLAYPDISAALQKTKGHLLPFGWITFLQELWTTDWININGAGMIEEYRGLGGTAILYSELFNSVAENPRYRHVEVVQIGLENANMQREMENFGIDFYKTHRVYEKNIWMNPEHEIGQLLAAIRFAADKHRNQRRKGAAQSPYINHPIEVADLLWSVGGIRELPILIAAILHDTIEDTDTSPEEIKRHFGEAVLALVLELSDNKSLPKQERKRLQIETAPHKSAPAKCIKLADFVCNLRDMYQSPPADWPLERIQKYLLWTEMVVSGLRGTNPELEECYDLELARGKKKVNI